MRINGIGFEYIFSKIADGNMSYTWGEKREVTKNKQNFLQKYKIDSNKCVKASLVHGADIVIVKKTDTGKEFECDSLITKDKQVVLSMVTGDCFPLVLCDVKNQIISLTHLGYRGVNLELAMKVVKKMKSLGADTKTLSAILGPGIRKESYVFETVTQAEDKRWQPFLMVKPDGLISVDLPRFIFSQLKEAGVNKKNIFDCKIDTAKDHKYFSHYRSVKNNDPEGRFLSAARIV